MKVFKYKFTKLIAVCIFVGIAFAVAAFAVTLFNTITADYDNKTVIALTIARHVAMFIVSCTLFVILVSLLFSSYYSVGNKVLKTSFGIIKSKFSTDNIESILLDRTTNKLAVTLKNETCIMIVIKPELYEDFVSELLKCNPSIEYSINSAHNSPDDQLKK